VSRRGRLVATLYGAAGAVYVLDRLTKLWAEHRLAGRAPIVLIPHVLDLSYTTNAGGAFGLFGGQSWLFFAASGLVVLAIVVASPRVPRVGTAIGLGMVLGGAVGNLTDRVVRGPGVSGQVVDFIHLHHWPTFNAADSSIVIGALVVALAGLRSESRERAERTP
jgi:signal peptidase II